MSRYIISPEAIQDLKEITNYFLEQSLDAGDRFIVEFENKCKNLIRFPSMGRSYSEIENSLRGLPIGNYIILYRIFNDGIEIVRVVSGYRDLKSLFE